MMSSISTMERTPLTISAGDLVVGPVHASFHDDDPTSLLHNYLVVIRQLRDQQREHRLTLRREDIVALADHLNTTETLVLGDLLDLMGATRAQRNALLSLLAAGALTIVATGSVALNLPSTSAATEASAAPAVVATAVAAVVDGPTTPSAALEPIVSVPEPAMAIPDDGGDPSGAVASLQFVATSEGAEAAAIDAAPDSGQGVADDGSIVAVGAPPVPPSEGVGTADDGSTVAVAPPPVPPGEGVGTADDGSTVAVAPPPVPAP